jgi:ferredoxin
MHQDPPGCAHEQHHRARDRHDRSRGVQGLRALHRGLPARSAVGYRYPELLVGCTGCRACLEVCPDFVFEVFKFDEPHEVAVG